MLVPQVNVRLFQHERCNDFLTVTSLVSQKLSHPWLGGSQRPDGKTQSTFPSFVLCSSSFIFLSFPILSYFSSFTFLSFFVFMKLSFFFLVSFLLFLPSLLAVSRSGLKERKRRDVDTCQWDSVPVGYISVFTSLNLWAVTSLSWFSLSYGYLLSLSFLSFSFLVFFLFLMIFPLLIAS